MSKNIHIAQFSDCHLFAHKENLHFGAPVYTNLVSVLDDICQRIEEDKKGKRQLDAIVFTGDLSQDHSTESYQLFVDVINKSGISIPIYYVAGNHDDPKLLNTYLSSPPFRAQNKIELENWQLLLINSKSETPAGEFSTSAQISLSQSIDANKFQLIFMHHHPIAVNYFIDRHGLINSEEFWQVIDKKQSIKGIACGHIHRGLDLLPEKTGKPCSVYTCPATSIQFDPVADSVKALPKGPGYRLFTLQPNGNIATSIHYIE